MDRKRAPFTDDWTSLQAISELMDRKLAPVTDRLDKMDTVLELLKIHKMGM